MINLPSDSAVSESMSVACREGAPGSCKAGGRFEEVEVVLSLTKESVGGNSLGSCTRSLSVRGNDVV